MKTKWYNKILIILLLLCSFNAFAQNEAKAEIELKLTDKTTNTSHSYKLYGANYSLNNPFYNQDESKLINNGNCSISIELGQIPDEFLLKWMAGLLKNTSGVITMVTINDIKNPRKMTFTDGELAASSESFYVTSGSTSPQMSFYVKTLAIDGTTIFSQ
ncbi:hypothetical protein ASU31_20610 [Pedobacter ginsenosidimutans]|uniref:Lipid/polyisoprenoid-binding YceI-like domain-containing protein n=1 Tax=Pedobacter ginsenosidimutans TaxID=687842 RepID=A0A0T5VK07_9SPHI|nr:type VI secretion system tube protein TssD [Pedobacter ginsenosidimutans]KRT14211.1 hypothetical protein ASU31_20610 [Pedobacter ginsenosidimutans]